MTKISWQQYKEEMPIVERFVRVIGSSHQYNEATNAADTKRVCRLPGGLTGLCTGLHGAAGAVLVFHKREDQNEYLWKNITHLTPDNEITGLLKVYMHPGRFRGLPIGEFNFPKIKGLNGDPHKLWPKGDHKIGTGMGTRG